MGWPCFENVAFNAEDAYQMPIIWAGGYLNCDDDIFSFHGQSGDFGGLMFGRDVCDVARFCAAATGFSLAEEENDFLPEGEELCQGLLNVMFEHKLEETFYERLVERLLPHGRKVLGQQVSALMTMKVADMMAKEPSLDYVQTMIDALESFNSFFLVYRVAGFIQQKQKASE
jgi:hypothetical protein